MDQVGALILAADPGSGFGGALALGSWGGESLVRRLVDAAIRSGIREVLVVLGPRSDDVLASSDLSDVTVVVNDDFDEGSASSIRAGLDTMWRLEDLETAVIVDLDRPTISDDVITALFERPPTVERPMTVLKYRYARGGPIAVDRSLWPRLMGLEGNVDLLDLAAAHPDWVAEVRVDAARPPRIETPDDLAGLRRPRRPA